MSPTGLDGRRVRPTRVLAMVVVVAVAVWAVVVNVVVQRPRVDTAVAVDAVLVLGGLDGTERTRRALGLASKGLTDTLVFSMPVGTRDTAAKRTCAEPPAGVRVICFRPDPSTTRGEARELAALAAANSWDTVAVVTSRYHVSRSRMIIGRCFPGRLVMLVSNEPISVGEWAYQYVYQSVGYVKAEILQGC